MEYGANFIKPSEMWKEIKPKIGEMLMTVNNIETQAEKAQKEAYEKGYENGFIAGHLKAEKSGQSFYEDGYKRGLADAWEAARKICLEEDDGGIPASAINDIFNVRNYRYAVKDYSASECIEKIRHYEQKQEEEKKESIIAEEVMRQYLDTFCHGQSCKTCPLNTPDFTCGRGRHFLTSSPVSNEEVRKAYTTVIQNKGE